MVTNFNSAINVPTDTSGFVELINSTVNYYVGPSGNDDTLAANNSTGTPWATLTKVFDHLENKRIANDVDVNIWIMQEDGMTGWDQNLINDTLVTVKHPNADRIQIKGYKTNTIPLYAVNYYDSLNNAVAGGDTGGYLMELTVPSGLDVFVGDFISITDTNYTATAGVSGACLETDFYEYKTDGNPLIEAVGNSYEAGNLSLRKTLMLGCHEVIGVDYDQGDSVDSGTILVHVRHTNPTEGFLTYQATSGQGAIGGADGITNAYITPQSLRWNSTASIYPSASSLYAGNIQGNMYNTDGSGEGATQHRFFGTTLPISSGFTAGATGAYPFFDAPDYGDGFTGANGLTWDSAPETVGGNTAAYQGITVKHLPCRVNFTTTGGLKVIGTQLGKIQDVVFCGPGFADNATTTQITDGSHGLHVSNGGGIIDTSNFAVCGFDSGVRSDHNAQADVPGTIAQNCRQGFVAEQNGHLRADSSIASGCFIGYYALNQSHIDAPYSIAVANNDNGFYGANNSSINAELGVSCLNGGHGYEVADASTLRLTKQENVKGEFVTENSTEIEGGTHDRYHFCDRTGSFAFRNSKSGVHAENSTVYASNARASYNKENGFCVDRNSHLDGLYLNSYYNGHNGASQSEQNGIMATNESTFLGDHSTSFENKRSGVRVSNNSYAGIMGITTDHNETYGFEAKYNSKMISSNESFGGTGSSDGAGTLGTFGFYASEDSVIYLGHDDQDDALGSTGTANNGVIRDY